MTNSSLDLSYNGFCMKLTALLKDEFGGSADILFREVEKNNGMRKTAMLIIEPGVAAVPTFYTEELYSKMGEGMQVEDIADVVIRSYKLHRDDFANIPKPLEQKNSFLECLRVKIINTDANRELLQRVPSEPFLDLSVVPYVEIGMNEGFVGEAVVGYEDLKRMNVTPETAMSAAKRNTFEKDPPRCETIEKMIEEAGAGMSERYNFPYEGEINAAQIPLYVFTRSSGRNGAVCILCTELFEELSEILGSDLMILPSSVNELIVLPDNGDCSYSDMKQAVYEINRSCLLPTEVLSDSVYRYSTKEQRIEIL